jgi:hypothetical protein
MALSGSSGDFLLDVDLDVISNTVREDQVDVGQSTGYQIANRFRK